MKNEFLRIQQQEKILIMQINHPPVNTLSLAVCQELYEAFQKIPQTVRTVVLTGNEQFFSAGANVKEFSFEDPERNERYFSWIYEALQAVCHCPVPVIAAINGVSMGGGMELALCCDVRIVDEKLRMGATSTNMGLVFCTQRLPRLIGISRAAELLLSARVLGGAEAKFLGIAHDVAPAGKSLLRALNMAENISSKPVHLLKEIKQLLYEGSEKSLSEALQQEKEELFAALRTPDFKQHVQSFLQRKNEKE